MDALSEALSAVRMTGAIFYHAECTAPWGFAVPTLTPDLAQTLAPGAERLVTYHLVTEGEATVRIEGDAPAQISAGDVVVIPHGHAHTVTNGSPANLVDSAASLSECLAGNLRPMRLGGGGALTRFICGYFGCERHADRMFLAGLPNLIKIDIRRDATGGWLEASIRHLVSEAGMDRPGRAALLAKAAETLFIEALRRYMEELPGEQKGWLAGARDPVIGRALALMHCTPFRAWTLTELAREAGASRSVLADRFTYFLGEGPLTYLTRWRLQLAARKLETGRDTIVQVAASVGYDSEAAFIRAFKREFGAPPARYRKQRRLAV